MSLRACAAVLALLASSASAQGPGGLPDPDRITVSAPDVRERVTVRGRPGAVEGGSRVHVQCLESGALLSTWADHDGAFEVAGLPAPAGTTVAVNSGGDRNWSEGGPTLYLTANAPPRVSDGPLAFSLAGSEDGGDAYWTMRGTFSDRQYGEGDVIALEATFRLYPPEGTELWDPRSVGPPQIELVRIADGDGRPLQASFLPVLTTPTGIPLFGRGGYEGTGIRLEGDVASTLWVDGVLEVRTAFEREVPPSGRMPAGVYAGRVRWATGPGASRPGVGEIEFAHGGASQILTPAFRVRTSAGPRMPWMLLADTVSNGTRGSVAAEDRGRFDLGTKVCFNTPRLVVPRLSPEGRPLRPYALEPFLPTVSYGMGGPDRPVPPMVRFRFPSGSLEVRVTRPDGTVDHLGPAPLRAARTNPHDGGLFGPSSVRYLYQLTTLDPAFEYSFPADGRYRIEMKGEVEDVHGLLWQGGGTYDVDVGRVLDLDTGTFLSTPFEVGDAMSPVVHVRPPVPAEVEVDLRLVTAGGKEIRRKVTGRANRFGYFHPGASAERLEFVEAGEYVVDVTATYDDPEGGHWVGSVRGASVVAPRDPEIAAHGKRGILSPDVRPDSTPQWYVMHRIDPPGMSAEDDGGPGRAIPQMYFPYSSGDVQWATDDTASGIFPVLTIHDPERVTRLPADPTGQIEPHLVSRGELAAVQHPEAIETWAYYYVAVQRPGVTVRSFAGEGEVQRAYWQFGDPYNGQPGNGRDGDRPGDVKLQYGGVVHRDAKGGSARYAIYGSMSVMIPRGTELGQRVFPPFQGAAGGPSGGPILELAGEAVDLFFTPVGVMPGSVLETGDVFSLSGAVWPTLPSKVEATITTPGGRVVTLSGRANRVGHYYLARDDFVVEEPGAYAVRLVVTHDGETSAGPVEEPFPTGGVLGARERTFFVHVVPRDSAGPALELPRRLSAERPFAVEFEPTLARTTEVRAIANLTGTVLESRALDPAHAVYSYDLERLRRVFDNLDRDPSDTVVLTFAATGFDSAGRPTAEARQVLLQGRDVFVAPAR